MIKVQNNFQKSISVQIKYNSNKDHVRKTK